MTREEAKDLLDNLIGVVEDNHNSDYDTALKMAIKALEKEPCEDCISRAPVKKAIDEMVGWIESGNRHNCDYFIVDKIEEIIKELSIDTLPSVQPKPDVLNKIRAEFIRRYPKNYMGEPEADGGHCVFSLDKVLEIIDKCKESEVKE